MPSAGHEGLVQLRKRGIWPGWRPQRVSVSISECEWCFTQVWEGLKCGPDRDSAQKILSVCVFFSGVVQVTEMST